MNEHKTEAEEKDKGTAEHPAAPAEGEAPHGSPQTDPTNPNRPESVGVNVPAERGNERRADEPGLTDADRARRHPTY